MNICTGVDAQKRIRDAKVLVYGLSGIGSELCKNLILSGISVTICDDHEVREVDLEANFYLTESSIGNNVKNLLLNDFRSVLAC